MRIITIRIAVPDGVTVAIEGDPAAPTGSPDFENEPLPPEPGVVAFRGAAVQQPATVCPVHLKPWKIVPAGISKKTGKPYNEFRACPEQGCNERPAA